MNKMQTITDICDVKDKIKKGIKTINTADYAGQKFGDEQEYTYEGLLGAIDSLLTDVTTIIKKPMQFLKLSTFGERRNISDTLNNIQNNINDPHILYGFLDNLKKYIRPFNIHYTKEMLIEFDNELSELTRKKQEFSKSLDDLNSMVENKGKADEMLISLQEKNTELENYVNTVKKRLDALNDNLNNVRDNAEQISEIKNQSNNHKELIDNFVEKIVIRERDLEIQTRQTKFFNEKLKKFTDERDELLKTAKNLIEEAKTSLGYKKAAGISSAFQTQLDNRENGDKWLTGAKWFIGIAISLTAAFILVNQSTDLNTTLARISIVSLPFAGAWFCAGQYTKLKNIAEDYAYKTMLAQSIIGFSEQLKDKDDNDEAYKTYMKKMLDEIHQHPLKNHKKQEAANPYKKLLDNLKDLISKNDTPP